VIADIYRTDPAWQPAAEASFLSEVGAYGKVGAMEKLAPTYICSITPTL
jgi:hypothetical protein